MRKAVSVTLDRDNLLWLRAQAAATASGSVSGVLDRIVAEARHAGRAEPGAVRSVVGTIDLPEHDSDLQGADAHLRSLFTAALRKPMLVRERAGQRKARRARRG